LLTEPYFDLLDDPGFKAILTEWFDYKAERNERYTPIGWRNLLSEFRKLSVADLERFARRSMASGWKGITITDGYVPTNSGTNTPKLPAWLPANWREIAAEVGVENAASLEAHTKIPADFRYAFETACRAAKEGRAAA